MKMKIFQGDTMQEALSMVKEEMGPDAVILKSRRATRKIAGKSSTCFEVTAAQEESLATRPANAGMTALGKAALGLATVRNSASQPPATPALPGAYDWRGSLRHVDEEGRVNPMRPGTTQALPATANALAAANPGSLLELLRSEIREMKEKVSAPNQELKILKEEIKTMMESAHVRSQAAARIEAARSAASMPSSKSPIRSSSPLPLPLNSETHGLQEHLMAMEVESDLASELVQALALRNSGSRLDAALGSQEAVERNIETLNKCMSERIRVTGGIRLMPGRPTTVALVGPTGVGKTTTLAKLAALAKIQQGKKVGIISADSFRMGANEQLELFGRTAGIPVRPVFSPADVAQAQQDFSDRDLILVDTAGRSHTHLEMWRELQGLLRCLHPDEIHLVLSGPTRMRELRHQYGLYRDLGATSLIFTKLDECISLGCLYNLARRAEAPLSYLCNGQVIPDHILLARPDTLASAITDHMDNQKNEITFALR